MSAQLNFPRRDFEIEAFFARRLKDHGVQIQAGDTTPEIRKERIRAAIIGCRLECVIIGRAPDGGRETYAQSFERYYHEPLKLKGKGHG